MSEVDCWIDCGFWLVMVGQGTIQFNPMRHVAVVWCGSFGELLKVWSWRWMVLGFGDVLTGGHSAEPNVSGCGGHLFGEGCG